jgi:flagellar biosynthesis/type III secretory pathway M-ring protein FliF/YscJ
MDLFKSQFERIQQQLAGLTASQKMLAGALVAVMVLTLMHWGRYAGEAELAPLLAKPMAAEEVRRISEQLDAAGIKYEVSGDRILVPADKQAKVFATLAMAGAMPRSTHDGFDEIVKKISPWDGQNRQDKMFNRGKEVFLSEVIGNLPDVFSAQLSIDPTQKRQLGGGVEPTASLNITMKPGVKAPRKLVEAAARIVSGAQSGLTLKNIQVVVNGAYHPVSEEGDAGGYDQDRRQQEEERLSRVVLDLMKDIPGLQVWVSVKVDHQNRTSEKVTFDEKGTLHKALHEHSETKEQSGGAAPPPIEPAAGSNIPPVSVSVAAAGGPTLTSTTEKVDYGILPAQEKLHLTQKAGAMLPVGASVRVPRSYFVHIAKKGQHAAKEPDEAVVEAVILKEMRRIQEQVAQSVALSGPEVVATAAYYDQLPPMPAPAVATAGGTVAAVVMGHTKELALGALALVSLFMASMIVKKSAPAPALATAGGGMMTAGSGAGGVYGGRVLDSGELLAGEAGEGKPLLDGMELDEDAVRTQQMLDQVATLVDENPDSAASLVRRWMIRS